MTQNITANAKRSIDGIRLTSILDTIDSGEIVDGGIGFNFVVIRVTSKTENISCLIENFENGTYTTLLPTTTILPTTLNPTTSNPTIPNPEQGDREWGKTDNDTKILDL